VLTETLAIEPPVPVAEIWARLPKS
jgi:hypothetical protein